MPMSPDAAERAAAALIDARLHRRWLTALPDGCVPQSSEDAYLIHERLASRFGPVSAFKAGATGPGAPSRGSVAYAGAVHTSPARIPAASMRIFAIEAEFGFSFGRDLPPRSAAYSEAEVLAAVAAVHAAIEIVESRFVEWQVADANVKLADSGGNDGIVIGPAYADWRSVDFARVPVRLLFDGKEVARAGGTVRGGGNPLPDMAWLANSYAPRFGGIRRGQIVMTGSCTGITQAHPGATVVADFDFLGQASVVFET